MTIGAPVEIARPSQLAAPAIRKDISSEYSREAALPAPRLGNHGFLTASGHGYTGTRIHRRRCARPMPRLVCPGDGTRISELPCNRWVIQSMLQIIDETARDFWQILARR